MLNVKPALIIETQGRVRERRGWKEIGDEKRSPVYNDSLNRSCKEDGTKKEEGRNEWGGGRD